MESANFHHHQQEDDHQLLGDPSGYALAWYQNPILNNAIINNTNSRDLKKHLNNNIDLATCFDINTPSIAQDLGFSMENFMAQELQHLARIKHEFSEIISNSPTSSSIEDLHLQSSPIYISKNDHEQIRYTDNNNIQDVFINQIKGGQFINQISSSGTNACSRGTFSQIFPTINISSLNQSSSSAAVVSSLDMNLPALDLVGSTRFNGNFSHNPSSLNVHNLGGLFKDTCLSYDLDQMHQLNHNQEVCPSNISPAFITKSTEAKRAASNYIDVKAPQAITMKKSKLESRPSCAPLKVRKEKLGDRISALQQMVAPFGKTDTASVLMEAIGYIKFLQNQVETLSVPYMNSTSKTDRISTRGGTMKDGNEETKKDLRSRGLCLVPLSCLSYVTYGSGSVWSTP